MVVDFGIGRVEAALEEARLEQRQRQRGGDDPGGEAVLLVGQVLAIAHRAPGEPGHDEADDDREHRRLAPAAVLERERRGERAEEHEGGRRHSPGVDFVLVRDEVDQQPGEAEQTGEKPRPQRPVRHRRVAIDCLSGHDCLPTAEQGVACRRPGTKA